MRVYRKRFKQGVTNGGFLAISDNNSGIWLTGGTLSCPRWGMDELGKMGATLVQI
jgi:hypothetical protein